MAVRSTADFFCGGTAPQQGRRICHKVLCDLGAVGGFQKAEKAGLLCPVISRSLESPHGTCGPSDRSGPTARHPHPLVWRNHPRGRGHRFPLGKSPQDPYGPGANPPVGCRTAGRGQKKLCRARKASGEAPQHPRKLGVSEWEQRRCMARRVLGRSKVLKNTDFFVDCLKCGRRMAPARPTGIPRPQRRRGDAPMERQASLGVPGKNPRQMAEIASQPLTERPTPGRHAQLEDDDDGIRA